MGFLSNVLGSILGSVLGGDRSRQSASPIDSVIKSLGGANQAGGGNLLAAVLSMVQENGGLSNVLDMFRNKGMAREADSWVSTGPNLNVSSDKIQEVFGDSSLNNLAQQIGLSHGQANWELTKILPELVNRLTPEGKVPENHADLISQGLEILRRKKA
ncbi:MAG: YidB family protein [Thermodesulfobacteriota bacterium]|jgi:uncharacterized protein YidB (DUF937 family)|nr:MAG: YidB family protein [Thermodesulfobacteriota bacterium]